MLRLVVLEDHPGGCKQLGSPSWIRHKVRPFGRGPTTRSFGDLRSPCLLPTYQMGWSSKYTPSRRQTTAKNPKMMPERQRFFQAAVFFCHSVDGTEAPTSLVGCLWDESGAFIFGGISWQRARSIRNISQEVSLFHYTRLGMVFKSKCRVFLGYILKIRTRTFWYQREGKT